MGNKKIAWVCTDPDTKQYGRRLSTYVFEFKEELPIRGEITGYIDLEEFSFKEIMDACESYYDNMDELFRAYGKDSCWIIAECIFEQWNDLC